MSDPTRNYLRRHWLGEVPLPQSFWVNTILVNLGLALLGTAMTQASILSIVGSAIYIITYWVIIHLILIWQYTGVWRSATIYASQNEPHVAATLAKVFIVIFSILAGLNLVERSIPQVSESIRMVAGDSRIGDFRVTLLPNGKAVEFSGGIKLGAARRLTEVLTAAPYVTTVYLETPGGRYGEALEMARIIKDRNLSTYVPRICVSSGIVVFLAGKERTIQRGAKLGFHSFSFPGEKSEDVNSYIRKFYREAGVSSSFIAKATKSLDFWFPTSAELVAERIVTKVSSEGKFGLGTAELQESTLEKFRESIFAVPMYRALSDLTPKAVNESIEEAFQKVQDGAGVTDSFESLNALLLRTVIERTPAMSDAAAKAWIDFNVELIEKNMAANPSNILLRLNSAPESQAWSAAEIQRRLPNWPKKLEHHFYTVLFDSYQITITKEDREIAENEISKILTENFTQDEIQLLTETPLPVDPKSVGLACRINLRFYKALRNSSEAGRAARYLISGGQ